LVKHKEKIYEGQNTPLDLKKRKFKQTVSGGQQSQKYQQNK